MSSEPDLDDLIARNRLATVARVLSGTAHDVNNALQIIGGSAELLENHPGLTDGAKRALARIRAQSVRAGALIEELTRFAKGREEPTVRVALKDIVHKAVSLRTLMIRRAGLAMEFEGENAPSAVVSGRADQLLQAVLNVIMDAEQALDRLKGGVMRSVLSEEAGDAVLRVFDNAPDPADPPRPRGFDVPGTNRPVSDLSPLGLDAARLIARAHGGDLALDRATTGSCVTLRLPLAHQDVNRTAV